MGGWVGARSALGGGLRLRGLPGCWSFLLWHAGAALLQARMFTCSPTSINTCAGSGPAVAEANALHKGPVVFVIPQVELVWLESMA